MHFLFLFIYFYSCRRFEPNIGTALCCLWDKIPPFVPKSTFFGSLNTFQRLKLQHCFRMFAIIRLAFLLGFEGAAI